MRIVFCGSLLVAAVVVVSLLVVSSPQAVDASHGGRAAVMSQLETRLLKKYVDTLPNKKSGCGDLTLKEYAVALVKVYGIIDAKKTFQDDALNEERCKEILKRFKVTTFGQNIRHKVEVLEKMPSVAPTPQGSAQEFATIISSFSVFEQMLVLESLSQYDKNVKAVVSTWESLSDVQRATVLTVVVGSVLLVVAPEVLALDIAVAVAPTAATTLGALPEELEDFDTVFFDHAPMQRCTANTWLIALVCGLMAVTATVVVGFLYTRRSEKKEEYKRLL